MFYRQKTIEGRNLTGQDAEKVKTKYVEIFKAFISADQEKEQEFVARWNKEYEDDKTKFLQKLRTILWVYIGTIDMNNDGNISKEEYKAQAKAQGFDSYDDKYFDAFPKNEDGTIPNSVLFEGLFEYYTNDDGGKASPLEVATRSGFKFAYGI